MGSKVEAIYKETVQQLLPLYEESEAKSVADLVFEDLLGIPKIRRLTEPEHPFGDEQVHLLSDAVRRLQRHEPVQHIIGHAYFYGRKYLVNAFTLIPRPETEELVDLILRDHPATASIKILDIGTGTGCIGISLAGAWPGAEVDAWDISEKALEMAAANARANKVRVNFHLINVLDKPPDKKWDLMVSNPPYIPQSERLTMNQNVVGFEPESALFVPDEDPLLFYRRIGAYGKQCLSDSGKLYLEIHERFGSEVHDLLAGMGYRDVVLIKDLQGKDRMIKALRTRH